MTLSFMVCKYLKLLPFLFFLYLFFFQCRRHIVVVGKMVGIGKIVAGVNICFRAIIYAASAASTGMDFQRRQFV